MGQWFTFMAFVLACGLAGGAAVGGDEPAAALKWRVLELGFGSDAQVTAEEPREGKGSLKLHTFTEDPGAWSAFARVLVTRADREPLGTLGQLAAGGSLTVDMFRHPDTGRGFPDYSLPLVCLHVRSGDGDEEAVLLWESPYNGYPTDQKVPEGVWIDDIDIASGTFWMRFQGRNYNRAPGFVPLKSFADGFTMTHEDKPTLKLGPDTQVIGVEVGSGPNLPGLMVAYIDDIRLSFAGGQTYHCNFEPEAE